MPALAKTASSSDRFGLLNYGKQLEESRAKYSDLQKEFDQLEIKYQLLLAGQLDDGNERAREMVASLQNRIQSYEANEIQWKQTVEELEQQRPQEEINKLKEKLNERENDIQRLQGMISQLNKEVYLNQQQKDSQSSEINKMEHLLKELQASAQIALHDSRSLESSWQEKWEEVSKQHFTEKSKLEEQWKELNDAYKKLQEENLSLQQQLVSNHLQPNTAQQEEWQELQKQLVELQREQTKRMETNR